MKILHTADWHIGQFKGPVVDGVNLRSQDTVKCLEYMVQVAIEEKPDIVCVSGDIFHQEQVGPVRYSDEMITATNIITSLAHFSKYVIVMRGTPNHDEEMYKNGMKLVDIAKKLDVPASTVRRWKSTQNWDGKTKGKKNERSQKKKTNARHKGGQPGNRNAVGNKGGPLKPGDKIAEKHGAYSSVYWDVLDESEKDMIEDIPMDEEMLLIEQIQLFAVRERRIMAAINKYRNMNGEVSLFGFARTEDKRAFKSDEDKQLYEERIEEKVASGDRLPGNTYNMMTNMENKDNMIARLEKELSTVQSKKTKAIEALAKLRLEKQKIAGESKGNEVVRAWAEAVVKAREGENKDG